MASSSSAHPAYPSYAPEVLNSDTPRKIRIIAHMNADHPDSLSLYLRHFSRIPPPPQGTPEPKLVDISLSGITISHHLSPGATTPAITFIPFTPPMDSLNDVRPRLMAMAQEAQESQGAVLDGSAGASSLPRVTAPGFMGWVISLLVLHVMILFFPGIVDVYIFSVPGLQHGSSSGGMEKTTEIPDTWYTRTLLLNFNPLILLVYNWRRELWYIVMAIHMSEAVVMDRRLATRWGVRRGSKIWAGWIGWAFLEGVGSFRRAEKVWKGKDTKNH